MAQGAYHMEGEFHTWARRPTIASVATMYFFAAAALVLLRVAVTVFSSLFPALSSAMFFSMASVAFHMGLLFLPVTRYAVNHPGAARGMRLKKPKAWGVVLAVLSAVVGVMVAGNLGTLWLVLIESLGGKLSTSQAVASPPWVLASRLVVSALLPAVCEEWMFRGAVLSAFERSGTRFALVISSLLFVSLHGSVEALPVQLMIAFAMGVIAIATDSVVCAMIYHALNNALQIVLPRSETLPGEKLIDALGGSREVWMSALRVCTLGAVYAGVLLVCWQLGIREREKPLVSPRGAPNVPPWVIVVFSSGVITTLILYLMDLLRISGVNL